MTTIQLPLGVRLPAYVLGLILSAFGSSTVAYLLAEHRISEVTAAFLVAVIGGASAIAHTFALSHLSVPDTPAPEFLDDGSIDLPQLTYVPPASAVHTDTTDAASIEAQDRDGDTRLVGTSVSSSAAPTLSSGVQ